MDVKKGVLFLVLLSLFSMFVYGQPSFRDVGYEAYPWGTSFFGGSNPLDTLCFDYAWLVDFVVLFVLGFALHTFYR